MLHTLLKNKKLILASASPRRKELLKLLGLSFITMPADVDETIHASDHINPKRYVQKIALQKFKSNQKKVDEDCLIIAADTTVYLNKQILGKPNNKDEAHAYLKLLSGQKHIVYTGLSVAYQDTILTDVEKTYVHFANLSDEEIWQYIQTGEPMDKAGAYGIQGYGSQFIEKVEGCYFNVMGFPIHLFYKMVRNC
jgi:septum formation protein